MVIALVVVVVVVVVVVCRRLMGDRNKTEVHLTFQVRHFSNVLSLFETFMTREVVTFFLVAAVVVVVVVVVTWTDNTYSKTILYNQHRTPRMVQYAQD